MLSFSFGTHLKSDLKIFRKQNLNFSNLPGIAVSVTVPVPMMLVALYVTYISLLTSYGRLHSPFEHVGVNSVPLMMKTCCVIPGLASYVPLTFLLAYTTVKIGISRKKKECLRMFILIYFALSLFQWGFDVIN